MDGAFHESLSSDFAEETKIEGKKRHKLREIINGRTRMADGTIRGRASPPAGGGLPDARLSLGGGRRRAGVLAPPQPLQHERRREPGRMADDGGRTGVPRHAALAQLAARGATGSAQI